MKTDSRKVLMAVANACLDPKDVAVAAGVSYPVVQRAIKGQELKLSSIGKIARAIGVRVEELVDA